MTNEKLQLKKFDWNDLNNLDADNIDTFPSDKDLAILSNIVYDQKYGSKATYQTKDPEINSLLASWKLIATAKCTPYRRNINGYYGAAYYNVVSKHLVVAHRGTDPLKNFGSDWTDVAGIIFGKETEHMASAYHFTRKIVKKFRECAISTSVTGHSLGGWLSQTSAFIIKHPKISNDLPSSKDCDLNVDYLAESFHNPSSCNDSSYHLHVVTFESPGAFHIVQSYLLKYYPKYNDDRFYKERYIDDLDITTFLASPGIVNVINMHIGSLFVMRNISTHGIENIVKFWQSTESVDENLLKITDWPRGATRSVTEFVLSFFRKRNTENLMEFFKGHSFRMSVFESDEREFLKDIHNLKQLAIIEDKMTWTTLYENTQTNEIITDANYILEELYNNTKAKDISGFFDSFEIDEYHQVLTLTKDGFKVPFFIRLVKYFVRNKDLPAVVKEVIKNFPKYYRAFHRECIFINGIEEVPTDDIPSLNEFLKSDKLRVFQAIAAESTLDCVEKMFSLLKSKRLSFRENDDETLDITDTLFLNTDLLTILDRQLGIAKITPPNDDLKLIVVENSYELMQPALESLIRKVLKATPPSLKVIVVTKHKIDMRIENSPFYLEKQMEASDQSILFKHLTDGQQAKVFETEICFQGENMQLKNLIAQGELSNADFLSGTTLRALRRSSPTNKVSFGGTLNTLDEFERSYYIPRRFQKIILTDPSQFLNYENPHEKTTNFVLIVSYREFDARKQILDLVGDSKQPFEWHGSFQRFNKMKHKLILVESTRHRPNYNHFQSHFKEMALTAVWLFYDANKWYWQSSFGALNLGRFKVSYEERCSEQELLEIPQQLVIICDEPGMGKSTLLKNISEASKSSWVIFVDLNSHVDLLRKLKNSKDLVSVANFLIQMDDSSPSDSVGQSILKDFLQIEERVKIFFDGYDEIDDVMQSKVKDIVMTLLDQTEAKIFLSSRVHLKNTLEKTFSCYSNTFLPLVDDEKVEFLMKFWTQHPQLEEHRKNTISMNGNIKQYANQLLEKLRVSLNFKDIGKFIGVPLQLFLLGTASLSNVSSFLSDVESNAGGDTDSILQKHIESFDNVFHLYQVFVKEKFRISINEKLKLKQSPRLFDDANLTCLTEIHREMSFRYLFKNDYKDFKDSVSSDDLLKDENFRTILSVGIVQGVPNDFTSIQFIHRSLAEYFAADFLVSRLKLVDWKEKVIEFLERNYFHPQFEKIRFFFDHFISIQRGCDPIFRKCLNFGKEKQEIFTMLKENENKNCRDLLGRNVLHYAISYGDLREGILWCLIQNRHLFHLEDMFGCSFLSYWVLLPNLKISGWEDTFDDIYWILFIPEIVFEPTGPHDNTAIISQLREGMECNRKIHDEIMADLLGISKKRFRNQAITMFFHITLIFWKRTTTYLKAFALALMTNSEAHMKILSELMDSVTRFLDGHDDYQNLFAKGFPEIISCDSARNSRIDMLSLMLEKGCGLVNYWDEHGVKFEIQIRFENLLWDYCKEQSREEEMYEFLKTTKFLIFSRLVQRDEWMNKIMVRYLFEIYEKLKDESLGKEMSNIAQKRIKEIFEDCLPGTAIDKMRVEDSDGKLIFFVFRFNLIATFSLMLEFLNEEGQKCVLEERLEPLRSLITRLEHLDSEPIDSNSEEHMNIVECLKNICEFFVKNYKYSGILLNEILSLMTRNGCALFKYFVEHDAHFNLQSEFEQLLWEYCEQENVEDEMYNFVKTTNLLTFGRICGNSEREENEWSDVDILDYYLEFYKNLEDESLRQQMSIIAENLPEDSDTKLEFFALQIAKRIENISDTIEFLNQEDQECVLKQLRLLITTLSLRVAEPIDSNSEEHMNIVEWLLKIFEYVVENYFCSRILRNEMFSLMTRNGCAFFKYCVEQDENLELQTKLEEFLWRYCEQENVEQEMYNFVKTTNLLTFHRISGNSTRQKSEWSGKDIIGYYLEFYKNLEDESLRQQMSIIAENLPEDSDTKLEFFVLQIAKRIENISDTIEFLNQEDQECVLEQLRMLITRLSLRVSEEYMNIVECLLKICEYFVDSEKYSEILKNEMLSLMTRNGCALFIYCVKHDENLELQTKLEKFLWRYCEQENKEQEMYNFVKTTNLLTFRRICGNSTRQKNEWSVKDIIDYCLEFYENLEDESLREQMSIIALNRIKEIFEDGRPGLPEDSDRKLEFSVLQISKRIENISDTIEFLNQKDQECVLEQLRMLITRLSLRVSEPIDSNSEEHMNIVECLKNICEYIVENSYCSRILRNEMFSLMTRNGCALFKYYVKHDVNLKLQSNLESLLWQYCEEQNREQEMYEFLKTTNFLIFRRGFDIEVKQKEKWTAFAIIGFYYEFYRNLKKESLRQQMSNIARDRIKEIFEDGLPGTAIDEICEEDSRRDSDVGALKLFVFRFAENIRNSSLYDMLKFLNREDEKRVQEEGFKLLRLLITRLEDSDSESINSNSELHRNIAACLLEIFEYLVGEYHLKIMLNEMLSLMTQNGCALFKYCVKHDVNLKLESNLENHLWKYCKEHGREEEMYNFVKKKYKFTNIPSRLR